jgi:hypothetical protein
MSESAPPQVLSPKDIPRGTTVVDSPPVGLRSPIRVSHQTVGDFTGITRPEAEVASPTAEDILLSAYTYQALKEMMLAERRSVFVNQARAEAHAANKPFGVKERNVVRNESRWVLVKEVSSEQAKIDLPDAEIIGTYFPVMDIVDTRLEQQIIALCKEHLEMLDHVNVIRLANPQTQEEFLADARQSNIPGTNRKPSYSLQQRQRIIRNIRQLAITSHPEDRELLQRLKERAYTEAKTAIETERKKTQIKTLEPPPTEVSSDITGNAINRKTNAATGSPAGERVLSPEEIRQMLEIDLPAETKAVLEQLLLTESEAKSPSPSDPLALLQEKIKQHHERLKAGFIDDPAYDVLTENILLLQNPDIPDDEAIRESVAAIEKVITRFSDNSQLEGPTGNSSLLSSVRTPLKKALVTISKYIYII